MSKIVEQIDREIAVLEAKAERMRVLRADAVAAEEEIAALDGEDDVVELHQPELAEQGESMPPPVGANGDGSEVATTPGPKTAKAKDAVRREGAADRKDRSQSGNRQKVIDLVRAEPGLNGSEIARRLGISQGTASRWLQSASRQRRVRREQVSGSSEKRYYPPEHEVAHSDSDGAKTGLERKLVAALRTAPSALTTSEAAKNAGVDATDAATALAGLARRGVIRDVPRREDHHPRRWAMPVEAVAA